MLFNSYIFIFIFLPAVFFIYFGLILNKKNYLAKCWLVIASLFFYGWWNIYFLPILIVSILVNFSITRKIQSLKKNKNDAKPRKIFFLAGLLFNIAFLGYFKYRDFFLETINQIFQSDFVLLHLAFPLGISFFTLQQIAFLVDAYEDLADEPNFIDYSVFVAFFPQLIAGPIVHHQEMMPQFSAFQNHRIDYKNITQGVLIFFIGLFKKVVIADTFAGWATTGFDDATTLTFIEAWATSLSFTFQLYFDFSGYSDMAVGIALLFNIKLPNNFNSPFQASSIINFWARWHVTLTRFITTYLYTPIIRGFRSISFKNSMIATFLAMLIAGLWHGAAWTFVVFGAIHGGALVVNHVWKRLKLPCSKFMGWFLTLNLVNLSFIIFRANELKDAIKVIRGMLGFSGVVVTADLIEALPFVKNFGFYVGDHLLNIEASDDVLRMLFLAGIMTLFGKNSTHISNTASMSWVTIIIASFVIVLSIFSLGKESPFLYFNF